jgi:GTPase SAR1 family protein
VICYDVTNEASFLAVHSWLQELKKNLRNNIIIHIVGTKTDLVQDDPSKREVPFERCLAYAGEHLSDGDESWVGMDACHEVSARDDDGVDELFQVITRKLVERRDDIERERLYGPDIQSENEVALEDQILSRDTSRERKGGGCSC